MNFSDLFVRLGQGFGLVKAMRTVTERIESVRWRVTQGILDSSAAQAQERYLMGRLGSYASDPRWDEILKLKEEGRVEEARDRANRLRSEYDL